MRLRCLTIILLLLRTLPASAQATEWLIPPADGVIADRYNAPAAAWGPGHRGIDYEVPAGTAVRSAGAGTVTFAGSVAGNLAVTVQHDDGLETTYSILSEVSVAIGDSVSAGDWVGRVGESHPGDASGLHFGVKLEDTYVDPEIYLGPLDAGRAIHLVPVAWKPTEALAPYFDIAPGRAAWSPPCADGGSLPFSTQPPNDNIAIAVAGIGSSTEGGVSADMYEHGPEFLGYPSGRVYRFSYRGTDGPGLHEPYRSTDTYESLRVAARRLGELVEEVGRLHPGAGVDLIAHSQGGVVASAYLKLLTEEWDANAPRIEHLVTFSTPHTGAPAAAIVDDLEDGVVGDLILDASSRWANAGGPIPDPRSAAVAQLAPDSGLMNDLSNERLIYGTRSLALAIPNDGIVPNDRAVLPEGTSRTVPPSGVNGHSAIVSSWPARDLAYRFLRDAPETCTSGWDTLGPLVGRAVGAFERALPGAIP